MDGGSKIFFHSVLEQWKPQKTSIPAYVITALPQLFPIAHGLTVMAFLPSCLRSDAEVRTANAEAKVSSLEIELRRSHLEAQAAMEEAQVQLRQRQELGARVVVLQGQLAMVMRLYCDPNDYGTQEYARVAGPVGHCSMLHIEYQMLLAQECCVRGRAGRPVGHGYNALL
eukprot:1160100-Pelagomonas_calceolata.AAC.5